MVQIPWNIFWIVPAAGVLTLIFATWLAISIMRRPTGTPKMKEIGDMIFEGAWAFLKRQYSTIAIFSVVVAVIIGVVVGLLPPVCLEIAKAIIILIISAITKTAEAISQYLKINWKISSVIISKRYRLILILLRLIKKLWLKNGKGNCKIIKVVLLILKMS